jgi:hypothetical protein
VMWHQHLGYYNSYAQYWHKMAVDGDGIVATGSSSASLKILNIHFTDCFLEPKCWKIMKLFFINLLYLYNSKQLSAWWGLLSTSAAKRGGKVRFHMVFF